jgi:hypothetical protein
MIVTYDAAAKRIGENSVNLAFRECVDTADRVIKTRLGRELDGGTYTEYLRGFGGRIAFAKEDPIVSITELRVDWSGTLGDDTVVDLTGTFFDANRIYYPVGFPDGPRVARIVYVAGFSDTDPTFQKFPADLKGVAMRLIMRMWKQSSSGAGEEFKSETLGEYSYARFDDAFSDADRAVLDAYKRWTV